MTTAYELEQEIRKSIQEWTEDNPDNNDIDYDGSLSELVDSTVPIYTSELFELAAENSKFQYVDDKGLINAESSIEHIIQIAIYNWLSEHAWDEWNIIQEKRKRK